MRANCWFGRGDVRVENVPDPKILNPRDCIVRITSTAICGSDLHLYDGYVPSMIEGDILGHEFMGEVVEVGAAVKNLSVGDRVVVPFPIACGNCFFCERGELFAVRELQSERVDGRKDVGSLRRAASSAIRISPAGYAGGQAEYARVPFADVGPIKIENDLPDEKVLFLQRHFPTG